MSNRQAYAYRVTKTEWYDRGGFANSMLFRVQSRSGRWNYYALKG